MVIKVETYNFSNAEITYYEILFDKRLDFITFTPPVLGALLGEEMEKLQEPEVRDQSKIVFWTR